MNPLAEKMARDVERAFKREEEQPTLVRRAEAEEATNQALRLAWPLVLQEARKR